MENKQIPQRYKKLFNVETVDDMWQKLLTEGDPFAGKLRRFFTMIPSSPRCAACYTPFGGVGGALSRIGILATRRSSKNPRFCNVCDAFNSKFPGGAEVVLTMLFVDVRGSTTIAENMNPSEFSRLMNRFYEAAIEVLIHADGFIDKLVGDEVIAFFFPGYAGQEHARKAVEAGQNLLRATGYGSPEGPWVPVGVGINTGPAWVGSIPGTGDSPADFTAFGDNVNVTARLASLAGEGEVLLSEAAARAAQIELEGLESRQLDLKGKSEQVAAWVLRVGDLTPG
jgi:adenylate cyclase